MRGRRASSVALFASCAALLATGCGGVREDAGEAKGTFALQVLAASFPTSQSIARPTRFELRVRNAGSSTAPNVAVTLDSFDYTDTYAELAADKRPIWVVEEGPGAIPTAPVQSQAISPPGGGQTAYVNTWALGPLPAGAERTFLWHVVPVKAGRYTVHYKIAAGLAGRARAELPSGGPVQGALTADIAPAPSATHVNPATGQVVPGEFPVTP